MGIEKDRPMPDYAAMLADAEAKKAALEALIAGLRAALAAGALGVSVPDLPSVAPTTVGGPPAESLTLPRGAFLGKTVREAIKLYLSAIRQKKSNKEIAQALRDGGMESAGNFDNTVTHGLFRLKKDGVILRFDDGWGLADWYPESFRNRAPQEKVNSARSPRSRPRAKAKSKHTQKATAARQTGGGKHIQTQVEHLLRDHPREEYTPQAVADKVGIPRVQTAQLLLSKLASKGYAEKTPTGGYRWLLAKVQEMPKTG